MRSTLRFDARIEIISILITTAYCIIKASIINRNTVITPTGRAPGTSIVIIDDNRLIVHDVISTKRYLFLPYAILQLDEKCGGLPRGLGMLMPTPTRPAAGNSSTTIPTLRNRQLKKSRVSIVIFDCIIEIP